MVIIMKLKFKNAWERLKNTEKPLFIDWLLVCAIVLLCYVSFNHPDILCTATHGKDLIECLFKDGFFSFYDYTQSTAVYSITVYIAFAIWSLPVFLIFKIFGIPMWGVLDYYGMPYPVLLWFKLLPTLFYIAIAYLLYKIILEIKMDKNTAKWVVFLFISSPVAIFSQFIFGQYDSIGLFFIVLALYMLFKKRYYSFSIVCSVAITFKMFALFAFIPLLLLFEKRVIHIVKHGLIAISGYVITSLLFIGSKGYSDAMKFSGAIASSLFSTGIPTAMGTISLFTVAMIAICIFAYKTEAKDDKEFYAYAIYISLAVYASMFAFTTWHPQWLLYMIPFLSLAVVLNTKTNSSLILRSALSVGYIGSTVLCFPNNVDSNLIQLSIFHDMLAEKDIPSLWDLFNFGGMLGNNAFYSLFAGSIIVLLVMYFPVKKNLESFSNTIEKQKFFIGDRLFILARPLTLILYILPTFYYAFR